MLLEQNYRSTQTVLDAANGLIAHNESQKEKHLWTDGKRGEPIVIGEFDDEHAEARYVASEINRLVEEGYSRDSIAVFYRMNAQSRVLEDTLVRFEIPYQVIGGTKFYERAEIKDAVAYLQLLANPADEISFGRIVNSPRRGIGQQTQARILSHANTLGVDVLDVLAHPSQIPALGPAALRAVTRFADTIAALRQRAERGGPVAELLEATLHESGYLEALEAERTVEAEGRIENLEELVGRRGRVRRQPGGRGRPGDESPGGVPGPDLTRRRAGHHPRGGEPGDADVAAQRQGPRVRRRVRHRLRGGRLPALALARGGQRRGGASPRLRRGHARPRAPLAHLRPPAGAARRRGLEPALAVSLRAPREPGRAPRGDHQHRLGSLGGGDARQRATGFGERRRGGGDAVGLPPPKQASPPPVPYTVGDDVVHASFGEGVVTAVEAGAVVVVRFAGDGEERKLMADYAPLKRVA